MQTWVRLGTLVLCITSVHARDMRIPLDLFPGYVQAPIMFGTGLSWLDFYISTWAFGYGRNASQAYDDVDSTGEVPIAQVMFGQSSFRAEQTLAGGQTAASFQSGLSFARIRPQISYSENGAIFGVDIGWHHPRSFHVGMRMRFPVRSVNFELDNCCGLQEGLVDVCRFRSEVHDPNDKTYEDVYAYRLDFLSSLLMSEDNPLVVYNNEGQDGHITIKDIDITDANNNPVHVIQRPTGVLPTDTNFDFGELEDVVDGLPFVTASGLPGPGTNNRARFNQNTNYGALENDRDVQGTYFVVPTLTQDGIVPDAVAIKTAIDHAVQQSNLSAVATLEANGITFATQKTGPGLGNVTTQFFIGYEFFDTYYNEFQFGLGFPTDDVVTEPGKLLLSPRGNDNHTEAHIGYTGILMPIYWLQLRWQAEYHRPIGSVEPLNASFVGASVKNIGPASTGVTSWNWFLSRFDVIFLHPEYIGLGLSIGYEGFAKSHDAVGIAESSAVDVLGRRLPTSSAILSDNTKMISHKLRTELFNYWRGLGLFAGMSHVLAGRNSLREFQWYAGFNLVF